MILVLLKNISNSTCDTIMHVDAYVMLVGMQVIGRDVPVPLIEALNETSTPSISLNGSICKICVLVFLVQCATSSSRIIVCHPL